MPDRWKKIDAIFADALERSPDERLAFVSNACGEDSDLFRAVVALIESDAEAERVLGESATEFAAPLLPDLEARLTEKSGGLSEREGQIGPYRLVQELGRGGMGTVYLAERVDDQFHMRVALKLVRWGIEAADLERRFRYERQILASLDHPNIARLYDGGVSSQGRPYLVMEYVDGRPIDEYCDAHRFRVDERLALFQGVCEAVQYAHRNLVVHRDLKPGNILVTKESGVKLLDFGIAKLLSDEAPQTGAVPMTRTGVAVMTPEYASPEQVTGGPITTASDVYSLGVVLYELLTGRRPHEVNGRNADDVHHVLFHDDPAPPSTVVSRVRLARRGSKQSATPESIAFDRGTTPDRLRRSLQGDIDTLLLTALRKEPEARYPSAEAFLQDLRRHLAGLPIQARPPTLGYRVRKFAHRHRTALALTVGILALLVSLSVLYTVRIAQERNLARVEAAKARATEQFVTELFEGADPGLMRGDTLNVFQLLDRGASRIELELSQQPTVRASMQAVLGTLYNKLGDYNRALPLLESALATRRDVLGWDHEDVARSLRDVAGVRVRKGDYVISDSLFRAAMTIQRKRLGDGHREVAITLNSWADMLTYSGRFAEAESLFREAQEILSRVPGDDRDQLGMTRFGLASLLRYNERFDESELVFRDELLVRRELYGDLHPAVAVVLNDLGVLLYQKGEYDEAEKTLQESLEIRRALLGDSHPDVSQAMSNLSLVYVATRQHELADSLLRHAIEIKAELLGREHRDIAIALNNRAWVLTYLQDFDAAEAVFREALGIAQRVLGDVSADVGLLLGNVGMILQRRGALASAEPYYRSALEVRKQVHGEFHPAVASRMYFLAELLREMGRFAEAEEMQSASLSMWRELQGEDHPHVARSLSGLGEIFCDQGDFSSGEARHREAIDILSRQSEVNAENLALAKSRFGACLLVQARYEEAETLLVESFAQLTDGSAEGAVHAQRAGEHLTALYAARQRSDAAPSFPVQAGE